MKRNLSENEPKSDSASELSRKVVEPSDRNALKAEMFKTPPSKQWMETALSSDEEPEVIGAETSDALNLQMALDRILSESYEGWQGGCTKCGIINVIILSEFPKPDPSLSPHAPESDSGPG